MIQCEWYDLNYRIWMIWSVKVHDSECLYVQIYTQRNISWRISQTKIFVNITFLVQILESRINSYVAYALLILNFMQNNKNACFVLFLSPVV